MTQPTPHPLAITLDVAANLLSVHRRTIERRIASGELRIVRVGRSVRVRLAEIEALAAGAVESDDREAKAA